jgi:F-type H+-transporting ATPase subunit b
MATEHDSHSAGTEVPGGAAHSDVFPPFDTNHFSSQLLWLALTFGALYLLMSRIALPRVAAILENRQATITGDLDYSIAMQKQAEEAGLACDELVANARMRAQALAEETHLRLAEEAVEARKALEADLKDRLGSAELRIAEAKARAMHTVEEIATEAATAIVQQLSGKTPDAASIASALAAAKTA